MNEDLSDGSEPNAEPESNDKNCCDSSSENTNPVKPEVIEGKDINSCETLELNIIS